MNQDLNTPTATFEDQSPCPYFRDGRTSTIEFILPGEDPVEEYHSLLARGYRRLGRAFYHNLCKDCASCIPLRIKTESFLISRSQKRVLNKNTDMKVTILSRPDLTTEKIMLYHKYVNIKHADDSDSDTNNELNVLLNLHYGYGDIIEMNYHLEGRLAGVGIVDAGVDALSSNYCYYDPDILDRSPGTFSILKEIELAQSLGKAYYYLGFYIRENAKMSYKKGFRPNQLLINGRWIDSD